MKNKTQWIELLPAGLYFLAACLPDAIWLNGIESPSAVPIIIVTVFKALYLMIGVTHIIQVYNSENERRNDDG